MNSKRIFWEGENTYENDGYQVGKSKADFRKNMLG
jgi:hypothetical protein